MTRKVCLILATVFLTLLAVVTLSEAARGEEGKMTHRIFRLSHRTPVEMAEVIKLYLSKNGVFAMDNRTNSLIVKDYPENLEKIARLVVQTDVPAPQVRIKVNFMGSTTRNNSSLYAGAVKSGGNWYVVANPNISSSKTSTTGSMNLAVTSGSSGFIRVGQSVPQSYVTWFYDYALRRGYVTRQVVFKEVSTGFYATPSVRGDNIYLDVSPGISYFDGKHRSRVIFREARTSVRIRDGQTMVLGVSDSDKKGSRGLISRIVGGGSFRENQVFSMTVTVKIIKEN